MAVCRTSMRRSRKYFAFNEQGLVALHRGLGEETRHDGDFIICRQSAAPPRQFPVVLHLPPSNANMEFVLFPVFSAGNNARSTRSIRQRIPMAKTNNDVSVHSPPLIVETTSMSSPGSHHVNDEAELDELAEAAVKKQRRGTPGVLGGWRASSSSGRDGGR